MMKIKLLSVVFVVILFTSCDMSVGILNSENRDEYRELNLPLNDKESISSPSYGFLSGRWWQEDTDRGFNNEYDLWVSLPDSLGIAKFLFRLQDKSFSKKTTYTSGYIDLNGDISAKDNYNEDIRILRTYNRYPDRDPNEKWYPEFLPPNEETQFNNLRFLHLKGSYYDCCDLKYSLYHNQMGSRMRKFENDGKYIEDWKFETFDPARVSIRRDKKFDKKKVYSVWEDN